MEPHGDGPSAPPRRLTPDVARETVTFVAVGQQLSGRYRLERELGRGAMGIVFEASDAKLDGLRVAIKVLPPELAGSVKATARLRDEARAALRLTHTNILRLNSFEEDGSTAYLVMELLDGQSLEALTATTRTLPVAEVLAVARQVCPALAYAHRHGVVHRDVKPANLMVHREAGGSVVKVADFGIACSVQDSLTRLTGSEPAGTLLYAAPEVLQGARPDGRADQYSLAATLYELLAGDPPFTGHGLSHQILNVPARPIEGVPTALNAVLAQALAKTPDQRFPDCDAFLAALEAAATTPPGPEPAVAAAPQVPTAEPRLLARRLLAFPVDVATIMCLGYGLYVAFDDWLRMTHAEAMWPAWCGMAAYVLFRDALPGGASLGKRLLGLRVEGAGQRPLLARVLRNGLLGGLPLVLVASGLPQNIGYASIGTLFTAGVALEALTFAADRGRRRLGDRVAGTSVTCVEPPHPWVVALALAALALGAYASVAP